MTGTALCGCPNPADGWENWPGVSVAVNARMYAARLTRQAVAQRAGVPLDAVRFVPRGGGRRAVSNAQLGAVSAALGFPADFLVRVLAREVAVDAKAAARGEVDPTPPVLAGLSEAGAGGDARDAAGGRWPPGVSGLVVLVRPRPGDSPGEVARLLAGVPGTLAFLTALGDERPVLVFGPAGDPPSQREVLRALVATMAGEGRHGDG